MVYLLGDCVVAARYGTHQYKLRFFEHVAVLSFFFVPPRFSFRVSDTQYLITFGIMLLVALVISNMTASIHHQAKMADIVSGGLPSLYAMSRNCLPSAAKKISCGSPSNTFDVFEAQATLLLPNIAETIVYPRRKV